MDKSEGKDWFAKTLNNVTEETAKVYKISRIKLEIGTMNKTYNEKMHRISKKLISLIEEGKIDASLFEPEYSNIKQITEKIAELEAEADAIKGNLKIGFGKKREEKVVESDIVDITPAVNEDEKKDI